MVSSSLTLDTFVSSGAYAQLQTCNSYPPVTAVNARRLQPQTTDYIEAIDHRSTKLKIPISAVELTNALEDDGFVPGICRLYLEGRCRQGARCFQVHVSGEVLEELRKEAFQTPSCCYRHGAPCNFDGLPLNLTLNIGGTLVGVHLLCPTNCLWNMYGEHGNNQLVVKRSSVCREHRRGLCRFGEECSFLHICREVSFDRNEYYNPGTKQEIQPFSQGTRFYSASHANNNSYSNNVSNYIYSDNYNDAQTQRIYGKQFDDLNTNAQSFNNGSFFDSSFNNFCGNFGVASSHYSNCQQGVFFPGPESGLCSFSSTSPSRSSLTCRNRHGGTGSEKSLRAPLLQPLVASGAHTRASAGQRHNPYASS